jgi:hypothetical protein
MCLHKNTESGIEILLRNLLLVKMKFITGQNEREESTQNTTVTKNAACASYKIKATT